MNIGALIYDRIDQIDFTGPFEALSRLPAATVRAQQQASSRTSAC